MRHLLSLNWSKKQLQKATFSHRKNKIKEKCHKILLEMNEEMVEKRANQFSNGSENERKNEKYRYIISTLFEKLVALVLVNLESGTNFGISNGNENEKQKNGRECKLVEAVLLHSQKNAPKCNEPNRMLFVNLLLFSPCFFLSLSLEIFFILYNIHSS